jgi:malate dehydrogenase (oxaloacetate-decarboxylating)(NADP+)
MKLAPPMRCANLAKEPVPEQVNIAYGELRLNFGRLYYSSI